MQSEYGNDFMVAFGVHMHVCAPVIISDTYDMVVTIGSFCAGQVNDECFEELARITKPGARQT